MRTGSRPRVALATFSVSAFAALAMLAVSPTAFAEPKYTADKDAGAKPVVSIKNKSVELEIFIDKQFRNYAGLFADLMAEAHAFQARWIKEAGDEFKDDPEYFANGRRWTAERSYDRRSEIGHYVSILRSDNVFSGGAHGNILIDTILWDRMSRKRVSIRPLFNETADNGPTMTRLAELARLAVAAEKIAGTEDEKNSKPEDYLRKDSAITDGIKPALIGVGPVSLAPSTVAGKSSGLTFHYHPYTVGPYAEGPHTAFVPWQAFAPHLSAEGIALFGGERPDKDKEDY